jgi:hypothetical protein
MSPLCRCSLGRCIGSVSTWIAQKFCPMKTTTSGHSPSRPETTLSNSTSRTSTRGGNVSCRCAFLLLHRSPANLVHVGVLLFRQPYPSIGLLPLARSIPSSEYPPARGPFSARSANQRIAALSLELGRWQGILGLEWALAARPWDPRSGVLRGNRIVRSWRVMIAPSIKQHLLFYALLSQAHHARSARASRGVINLGARSTADAAPGSGPAPSTGASPR